MSDVEARAPRGVRLQTRARSRIRGGVAVMLLLWLVTWVIAPAQSAAAAPDTVTDIEFVGNRRYDSDTLRLRLRTKVGRPLDRTLLQEDIGTLYEVFDAVDLEEQTTADGVRLRFVVSENPMVRAVRIVGTDYIREDEVREVLDSKPGTPLADFRVENDARKIEQLYRRRGHHFVEVLTRREDVGTEQAIVYDIREGPHVTVDSIEFTGNESLPDDKLRNVMATSDGGFLGLGDSDFVDETLRLDVLLLQNYYRSEGYLDVQIDPPEVVPSDDREEVAIRITVREGPVYRIGDIRFEGVDLYPEGEEGLEELLRIEPGRRLRAVDVSATVTAIQAAYREEGYFAARVTPREQLPESGETVDIVFDVDEESLVTVRRLEILGNTITRDDVIRREITVYPGGVLNKNEIDKSISRLRSLRYFSRVAATARDVPSDDDPNLKDVIFEVDDSARTGQVRFAAGVSSDLGLIGNVKVTKRNFDWRDWPDRWSDIWDGRAFSGGGQTFTLDLSPGSEFSSYRVAYTQPWLFDKPVSFGWDLFYTKFNRFDYEVKRRGVNFTLGRRFTFTGKRRDTVLGVTGTTRIEKHEVDEVTNDSAPTAFLAEDDLSLIAQRLAVRLERLDNSAEPTSGWFAEGATEVGFAGDVQLWKSQLEGKRFWVLHRDAEERDHVLSLGGVFAVARELGGSESADDNLLDNDFVPIYERYRAGGSSSIRGFAFGGVGPHGEGDPFLAARASEVGRTARRLLRLGRTAESILENDGDPMGGDVLLTTSAEYQFPLYEKLLRGVVFVDAGLVRDDFDTAHGLDEDRVARLRRRLSRGGPAQRRLARRIDFDDGGSFLDDLRVSVGFGFRISIPGFGTQPLALDIGFPIRHRDGDDRQAVSFSVAREF